MVESKTKGPGIPFRPILAITISLVVCGLVGGYQVFVNTLPKRDVSEFLTIAASGDYTIELTLSFEARGDAFDPTALLVRLDGKDLLEQTTPLPAGVPVEIHPVEDLIVGLNELFIQVGTGDSSTATEVDEQDPFAAAGFENDNPAIDDSAQSVGIGDASEMNGYRQGVAKAIRVRVFDGLSVLAEKTVWSEPGETINSVIVLDIPEMKNLVPTDTDGHGDHNH